MSASIMHKNSSNSVYNKLFTGCKEVSILNGLQGSGGSYENHPEYQNGAFKSINTFSVKEPGNNFVNFSAFIEEFNKLKVKVYGY